MQIRVVRLSPRHPIVAALLALVLLALVLAVLAFGLTLALGVAAVGAVGLLVRRVLGVRGAPARDLPSSGAPLDPRDEVFPGADPRRQLPRSVDGD
jgi:hypothetical protein